ncbi:MAG: L-histidine N(alpha)-methyltransferase [Gammaproteobacteria bacterium]
MTTNTLTDIELLDLHPSMGDFRTEVIDGLSQTQKTLPPKYFYDEVGSRLFDQITEVPEYYPTLTEYSIMRDNIDAMASLIGPGASVIELGSGMSKKIRILLDRLEEVAAYVPVEISKHHLMNAARKFQLEYPDLDIRPVCADFTQPMRLPRPAQTPKRNVVYFPGSTIGNFYPNDAMRLLKNMSRVACKGGALLIGVDLKKDKRILEHAYNDDAGITAQFNLNILKRIKAELGAMLDIDSFEHRAVYNEEMGRIEMHLVSLRVQTIVLDDRTFELDKDEYILSECSHKFAVDEFQALASRAGFEPHTVWTDENNLFSVHYMLSTADNETSCK